MSVGYTLQLWGLPIHVLANFAMGFSVFFLVNLQALFKC